MSTKPTRQQERGCDQLVQALLLVAEAARLDGRTTFGRPELAEVARLVARASTAFGPDEIIARALEARGKALGLRSGTAELLLLIEVGPEPIATLLLPDDDFKSLVAEAEAELGEA